jgi:rod shape determining protein RodA
MQKRIQQWLQMKRYNWQNYDISLVVVVMILSLISAYVLSIVEGDNFSMLRSVFSIVAGLLIIAVFSLIDYHDLCLYIPIIYVLTTLMAAATKLSPLGDDQSTGSYRWLDFKIIKFQPSEICKIVVILALAAFFYHSREDLKRFRNFFIAAGLALLPTFFILIQSDLSSSVVIVVILIMMLACSGIGHRILGPVAAVTVPVVGFLCWYILQPNMKLPIKTYQLERITGWLNPEGKELGIMYQQTQSIISIASGKLYGKLLDGTEAARNYTNVDVTESDFIWTPISEEFGFLGCMLILALLSVIIIKCFLAAKNAKDYLGMMIAVGIGSMFCFQTFFNIGVTTSLLPNTGLPLPFLSNGLTSLLSNMMTIGILLNIGIQPNRGNSSFELH